MLSKNKIKSLSALQNKKNRREAQYFVVEGDKILKETLESNVSIEEVICTEDFFEQNHFLFVQRNITPTFATAHELGQCGSLETNYAGIAVLSFFTEKKDFKNFLPKKNELFLVLDNVQDPGNMGTILRIADWFGITEVICSEDSVELYNPKVIGATMGAFLRINVHYTHLETYFKDIQEKNMTEKIPILGAILEDGTSLYDKKMPTTCILVMGNESKGINKNLYPYINEKIFIPKFGYAESLNVGVATAIFCHQWRRDYGL